MAYGKMFGPGYAGDINGDVLDRALAYAYGNRSYQYGVTALAGGGRTGAPTISELFTSVDTVASAADSVQLKKALPGSMFIVMNNGANAMQVFANGSDTINGTAGATGVSQASAKSALYFCAAPGKWFRLLSA